MNVAKISMTFAIALVLVLTATGLWARGAEEEPAAAADKKYVTDPTTGKEVEAPRYGGTLTIAFAKEWKVFDPFLASPPAVVSRVVVEKLGIADWAIDRDEYNFTGSGAMLPLHAIRGALAESWEQTDPLTYVFHIREGVHWHNKAPMNGRELTAKDVEYNLHRFLGLGSGFTEMAPRAWELGTVQVESITATDKWTVVVKLKEPYLRTPILILDSYNLFIQPPEVIQQHGDVTDWRNVVGTGPFELTDFVEGSSLTYIKNPDYWGYDEKYPENRLPYVDEFRALVMLDEATRLAALRSGKIDYTGEHGRAMILSIDVAESLKRTNPELVFYPWSERSENGFIFNVSKPPFDDIRVRKAMNMAVDHETINYTYFKGSGDTTPNGPVGMEDFYVPFDEWPQEVKDVYSYNPEGAAKLLDQAGYPRGSDGIRFKTTSTFYDSLDIGWIESVVAYWSEIGVDVRLEPLLSTQMQAWLRETGKGGLTNGTFRKVYAPFGTVAEHTEEAGTGACECDDPAYNALYERGKAATTFEEQRKLIREIDMYFIKSVWGVPGPKVPKFNVSWPWVKGYNSEGPLGGFDQFGIFARLWIDNELKEAMGYWGFHPPCG